MSINLRRIHGLGINKIAVGLLEPIGCMPLLTAASSYDKCLQPLNFISQNYSQMLLQIVQELNKELGKPVFVTLDLYNSFLSVLATMQKRRSGKFFFFQKVFQVSINNAKLLKPFCLNCRHCYFSLLYCLYFDSDSTFVRKSWLEQLSRLFWYTQ